MDRIIYFEKAYRFYAKKNKKADTIENEFNNFISFLKIQNGCNGVEIHDFIKWIEIKPTEEEEKEIKYLIKEKWCIK